MAEDDGRLRGEHDIAASFYVSRMMFYPITLQTDFSKPLIPVSMIANCF